MPTSFEIGIVPGFRLRLRSLDRFRRFDVLPPSAAQNSGPQFSVTNPQKVLRLAKLAFEAHAFGDQRSICFRPPRN
jgi:hypothetical protein